MLEVNQVNNEKGLTLIELLVSLFLVSLVGLASYQLFTFVLKNYERTQAYCQITSEGSIGTSRIGSDIRSAVKPNNGTNAVNISGTAATGYTMDIYTYVSTDTSCPYKQIRYQLEVPTGTDYGKLRRTVWETNAVHTEDNPSYASDCPHPQTTTILRGVVAALFEDKYPAGTPEEADDRREIGVELILREQVNATPAIDDQKIVQTFVTRSQELAY